MKINLAEIAQGFIKRFTQSPKIAVKELAGFILENRLHGQIEDILLAIRDEYARSHGFVEAEAASAYPLSDGLKAELMERVKAATGAKRVRLNESIDKSVLGGVIVESPGMKLDLSLKTKLARLKA